MKGNLFLIMLCAPLAAAVGVIGFHPSALVKMMAAAALAGLAATVVVYLIGATLAHGSQIVTVRTGAGRARARTGEDSHEGVTR